MIGAPKIRGWKAFALLGALVAVVVLLLLPYAAGHQHVVLFLLVPIFLFIELVCAKVPYQPHKNHVVVPNRHVRSILFQRPPPSQA